VSKPRCGCCRLGNCCDPGELYQQSLDLQKGSLEGVYPLSKVVYSFVALVDSLRCSWTLPHFNSLLEMPEHQHDGQRENSHWARMRPCRVARREEALRRGMRGSGKAVPAGGEMPGPGAPGSGSTAVNNT